MVWIWKCITFAYEDNHYCSPNSFNIQYFIQKIFLDYLQHTKPCIRHGSIIVSEIDRHRVPVHLQGHQVSNYLSRWSGSLV